MAGKTIHWRGDAAGLTDQGRYTTGADWVGGVAPAAGDTALIGGVAGTTTYKIGGIVNLEGANGNEAGGFTLVWLFPGEGAGQQKDPDHWPGTTIEGQTILLDGAPWAVQVWAQNTVFANDAITATGTVSFQAYYDNDISGTFDIGTAGQTAYLQMVLVGTSVNGVYHPGEVPATTLDAAVTVAASSFFQVEALSDPSLGIPPVTLKNFGTITVQAGGTLWVDDQQGLLISTVADRGLTFSNRGTVRIEGAAGKHTAAAFSATVTGGGTIDIAGNGAPANATTATFYGSIAGENIVADDAVVSINEDTLATADGGFRFSGGSFTFGPDGAALFLHMPELTTLDFNANGKLVQKPDGVHPFSVPIVDFGAGDVIEWHFGATGSLPVPVWNQAAHELTVEIPNANTGPEIIAKLTLQGDYAASGFRLSYDAKDEIIGLRYAGHPG